MLIGALRCNQRTASIHESKLNFLFLCDLEVIQCVLCTSLLRNSCFDRVANVWLDILNIKVAGMVGCYLTCCHDNSCSPDIAIAQTSCGARGVSVVSTEHKSCI